MVPLLNCIFSSTHASFPHAIVNNSGKRTFKVGPSIVSSIPASQCLKLILALKEAPNKRPRRFKSKEKILKPRIRAKPSTTSTETTGTSSGYPS
jgi:hypothetical protein